MKPLFKRQSNRGQLARRRQWLAPSRTSVAPSLLTATAIDISTTSLRARVTFTGPAGTGAYYWIVQPTSEPNPTGAQIVAQQNGSGSAALASGSVTDTGQASPVDASALATGLTAGTSYEVAWVWYDGSTYSGVVVGTVATSSFKAAWARNTNIVICAGAA